MRESIGGAWIYGLALTFVLLFSCFLAIAINYSKVFRVKNEVVSIIENYSGFTDKVTTYSCDDDNNCTRVTKSGVAGGSLNIINNYLKASNYATKGRCPSQDEKGKWYAFNDGQLSDSNEGLLCARKLEQKSNVYSYEVVLFFNANLPLIGDIFKFKINGETNDIFYPDDTAIWASLN